MGNGVENLPVHLILLSRGAAPAATAVREVPGGVLR
jgi:hypothetical protein